MTLGLWHVYKISCQKTYFEFGYTVFARFFHFLFPDKCCYLKKTKLVIVEQYMAYLGYAYVGFRDRFLRLGLDADLDSTTKKYLEHYVMLFDSIIPAVQKCH